MNGRGAVPGKGRLCGQRVCDVPRQSPGSVLLASQSLGTAVRRIQCRAACVTTGNRDSQEPPRVSVPPRLFY